MTDPGTLSIAHTAARLGMTERGLRNLIKPTDDPWVDVFQFGPHRIEVLRFGRLRKVRTADVDAALHVERAAS